ncbi:hypothetical protein [Lacipirellula sp.]|uniref:hypothetical protein n=1 Tax=Lacipirellula sp. TaxID=2691419 RepID=UPI003D0CB5CB
MKLPIENLRRQGGIDAVNPSEPDDLFITCASFEERSHFVSDNLSRSYQARHAIAYVNREFIVGSDGAATRSHLYAMLAALARHSPSVRAVEGSWLNDMDQINSLREALGFSCEEQPTKSRITVDCTTFNRESLISLLLLIRTEWPTCIVRVVYASPERHGEWLSKGFRSIRNIMGLGGTQLPGRNTVVAILSGFEQHRTLRIIEEHEPVRVLLGMGSPPTSPEFLDRNAGEHALVLSRQDVDRFEFAAGDIGKCRDDIERAITPYINKYNIVLAPLSTKLSTIAALLVAERYPQIQMTYCLPGEYNVEDYTHGVKSVFLENLPAPGSKPFVA